jgi:hypothetical protein
MTGKAKVGDMSEIRMVMGIPNPVLQEELIRSIKEERHEDFPAGIDGVRVYPLLAISGGAANGAYGAGFLKGWSEEGSRPVFKVVTGVSTGAIIAPFAFLGKEYDKEIERLYTTMSTKDVMRPKGPFRIIFGDSLANSRPLGKKIKSFITKELLEKIAREHKRGRRVFVGTTDFDSQRFVIWDMGAIAVRGDTELFCKVILASASIPVVFPPVFIHVNAGGKDYDEMHVDGGTVTQMFTLYKVLANARNLAEGLGIDTSKIKSKCYIIRNGYVQPGYKKINDSIGSITDRTFDTITDYQGIGDAYRMYTFVKAGGNDFNLAFIPGDFRPKTKEAFDTHAMKELFDKGYQDALKGYKWHKEPPGLKEENF